MKGLLMFAVLISQFALAQSTDLDQYNIHMFLNCTEGNYDANGEIERLDVQSDIRIMVAKRDGFFSNDFYLVLGSGGTAGQFEDLAQVEEVLVASSNKKSSGLEVFESKRQKLQLIVKAYQGDQLYQKAWLIKENQTIEMLCTYPIVQEGTYGESVKALIKFHKARN